MPTAEQKDFIVDNGLDANESIKIGTQTVTSLVDSAQVSTIAREPANASAIALAGGASSKAYDSAELLPTSGNDSGDFGYVASTNRLYLWNGSGWYNIALINTSPTVTTSPDSNYELDGTAGTAVTVTMLAVDPEGVAITYTQTSDTATNFVNITQDSGVFTLTPLTKAQADSNGVGSGGTFSITFKATDGVNIVPRVSSFTISWIIEYNWLEATEQASFKAGDLQSSQLFGSDVGLDQTGSTAVIGARNHDTSKGVGYIRSYSGINYEWNNNTASIGGTQNFSQYGQMDSIGAFDFASDGTKIFVHGRAGSNLDHVYLYPLSTAYDPTTVVNSGVQNIDVSGESIDGSGTTASEDGYALKVGKTGTRLYVIDRAGDKVFQWNMSTANDLSTASYGTSFSISTQTDNPAGIDFKPDGTKMYIHGQDDRTVYEYNLSTAWEVNTATYSQNRSFATAGAGGDQSSSTNLVATGRGIAFNNDGTRIYIVCNANNVVFRFNLSTAYNITTAVYNKYETDGSTLIGYIALGSATHNDIKWNPDGSKMYVGASSADRVRYYNTPAIWKQDAKLQITTNRNSYNNAQFGYSAAISGNGNYAVFGAPYAYYSSQSYGGAFVYKNSSGSWSEIAQLEASTSANRQNDDLMGSDVDIDKTGTRIIVGASRANHSSQSDAGGAYIFTNNGSDSYSYETFLQDVNAASKGIAQAGDSVGISSNGGTYAIVGAADYNGNGGTRSGAAFIYVRSGTSWSQQTTLQASDAASDDRFGISVDIDKDGETAVVGAWYDDHSSLTNPGSAYVFTRGTVQVLNSIANTTLDHTSQPLSGSGLNPGATDPRGLTFNADGTKVYVTDNAANDLSTYSLSTAFDVSSGVLSYDGDSYSFDLTATAGSTPYSPRFNNDGTRMYILEGADDTIYQYNLTSAYDVSTMSYSNVSLNTTTQDSSARGIEFSPDGTKMYMVGAAANRIYQYTLSTPFDLSTASYDNKYAGTHSGPIGMVLHSAGTKVIVVTSGTNDRLYQYSMTTAYDISTASYDGLFISVSNEQATPAGLALNNDGTKLFLTGNTGDNIDRYSLDTSLWSQAQKLTAPTPIANNAFGESVSIDDRGTKIIVGERYYNNQYGRAYVYRKVGGTWYYTKTIYGSGGGADDQFGKHLELSGDGNRAIIGAEKEDTTNGDSGKVYIQEAPAIASGTTITDYSAACIVTAILEGEDNNELQGEVVALNKDGTLFAVSATNSDHNGNANAGAVRVYKKSGGTWTLQNTLTTNEYVSGTNNYYGKSLAVAADDYTIAVGMGQTTTARGIHIWTSSDSGATWTSQANVLGTGVVGGDRFGTEHNIDLSDDGNTLIVGARMDDDTATDAGAVYVFTRSGTTWTQQAKLQASDAQASDAFGIHCRISGDGNYIAVGAPYEDGTSSGTSVGKVYIFYYNGSSWSQQAGFHANDPQSNTQFGSAVAIDTDGNTVAISSAATTARCVYVFTRSGTSWSQQAKIERANPESGDNFGHGGGNPVISGDGNILYIGSTGDDDNGNAAGKGFIYTRSGTTWSVQNSNFTPLASNYAPGGLRGVEANDYYGSILAISRDGNTFAGGNGNHTNNAGLNTGAGYVMTPLLESY